VSARLDALAQRRERLIRLAATQRATLASTGAALVPSATIGDGALHVYALAKRHPAVAAIAAAAGAVVLFRQRRTVVWLGRAWTAWQAWQTLRAIVTPPAAS
jgi:hypothetical protein